MAYKFRYAICNEIFGDRPFPEVCETVRTIGYEGIEVAPFTLADNPVRIPAQQRREFRDTIESAGLTFVGLHWLLAAPKGGLHITTPDETVRARSWKHLSGLIDLCADLGPNSMLILGSPQQRKTTGGLSVSQATKHFADGLASLAPKALERGVTIVVEPMSRAECNVLYSLGEAASVVSLIDSPAVRTMFDVHNSVDEVEPHSTLLERHYELIRHVHLNEMDGRHPGTSDYDFKPVLDVLGRHNYKGWISLEVFDFSPGADTIAQESLKYLQSEVAKLSS